MCSVTYLFSISADRWRTTQHSQDGADCGEIGGENKLWTSGRADTSRWTRTGISSCYADLASMGGTDRRGTSQPVEVASSVAVNARRDYWTYGVE